MRASDCTWTSSTRTLKNKNSIPALSGAFRKSRFSALLLVAMWFTLAACGSSTTASSTSTTASSSSGLQSDLSYFKGKTVTLIAPDKPGGSLNSEAHIVAPYIAKYLNASVVVENIPAGHTIAGQTALEKASPNGLTIGILDVGEYATATLAGEKPLPYNPAKLDFLGSPLPATNAIVVQPSSPYKTFADVVNSTAPINTLLLPGTGGAIFQSILQALSVKVNFITGYANATDLVAGFLRGDGTMTSSNLLNMGQLVKPGKARAVLITGPPPAGNTTFQGVQTLSQYLVSNPVTNSKSSAEIKASQSAFDAVGSSIAAPENTPVSELVALRAAVKYAFTQSKVGTELGALGVPSGFVGPNGSVKATLSAEAGYKTLAADGIKFGK